jgi:hypothetical protein
MKEAVKLAWLGPSENTSGFKAPAFATSDGVSIEVGFTQSETAAIGSQESRDRPAFLQLVKILLSCSGHATQAARE